jgi:V/A-type H+-transporting ATPase subunit K
MEPIILAYIGVAMSIGLSGIGSAIGVTSTAKAAIGGMKKNSDAFGSYLVLCMPPATNGLYGFLGFFLVSGYLVPGITMFQAAAIFGACTALGIVNLLSAIMQGQSASNAIAAISSGHDVFGKSLMLIVFAEFYAIIAVASLFMVTATL